MRPIVLFAPLALALAALPAQALGARLLPSTEVLSQAGSMPADAPVATPAPTTPTTATSTATLGGDRMPLALHLVIGAAAGIVTVPLGLGLASLVGNLAITQLGALIPAFLTMGLFAPALTTLVAWLVGNWRDPGRFGFWLPFAASAVVNIACLLIGGFAGLSLGVPLGVAAFSAIAGLAVGGSSVGTMRLFQKKPAEVGIASHIPGVSDTELVPLATVAF